MKVVLGLVICLFGAAVAPPPVPTMSCQPPGRYAQVFHIQDVSPSCSPFINQMRSGVFSQFQQFLSTEFAQGYKSALASFSDKVNCWKVESDFSANPSDCVNGYSSMIDGILPNGETRDVYDALYEAASHNNWDENMYGRKIIMLYTDKLPMDVDVPGKPFDPNNLDCSVNSTPSRAEVIQLLKDKHFYVVFVVTSNIVPNYLTMFADLGGKLVVTSFWQTDENLLNFGLVAAFDHIYCFKQVPIEPTEVTTEAPTTTAGDCPSRYILQLLHLQDSSYSYGNDLINIKARFPDLLLKLKNIFFKREVSLATFIDKPVVPFGHPPTDYCYKEQTNFDADETNFINALQAAQTWSGLDWRESQYDAVYYGVKSTNIGWETNNMVGGKKVLRIVMMATDAGPHMKGDYSTAPMMTMNDCSVNDYPSEPMLKAELLQHDVVPLFVVTSDIHSYWTSRMYQISDEGKVLHLSDDNDKIVNAILEILAEKCE